MSLKKRARYIVGVFAAFALIAAACGGDDFEAGPLGAVEVAEGQDIQIRSLQAISGPAAAVTI